MEEDGTLLQLNEFLWILDVSVLLIIPFLELFLRDTFDFDPVDASWNQFAFEERFAFLFTAFDSIRTIDASTGRNTVDFKHAGIVHCDEKTVETAC